MKAHALSCGPRRPLRHFRTRALPGIEPANDHVPPPLPLTFINQFTPATIRLFRTGPSLPVKSRPVFFQPF